MSGRGNMPDKKTTAQRKGRRIAARMLCELERIHAYEASIAGSIPTSLFAKYRYKGEPQDNIVLRYLQLAAAHGDECVAGFCSVLSDHCGDIEAGSGPYSPSFYLRLSERKINEEGDTPTREQALREHELHEANANHPGGSLH